MLIRVNRTFYGLVHPTLYKDVNILSHTEAIVEFGEVLSWLFVPHVRHIRTLHMWGEASKSGSEALEGVCVNFLL
jgi:hypothetical protein